MKEVKAIENKEKINKKRDGQMYVLAVCDMLARENRIMRKNSEKIGEKRGEKRGRAIGEKQGRIMGEKQGIRNGIIQVAQNLINMKVSPEQIKKATGLTDEELEKLKI